MRKLLAILVTLVACTDPGVEQLGAVKRDVCACKDTSCADQAMTRVPGASLKPTPRTQALAKEIMDCRAKLEAAARPSTDPDAEGSAQPPAEGSAAPAATAPAR